MKQNLKTLYAWLLKNPDSMAGMARAASPEEVMDLLLRNAEEAGLALTRDDIANALTTLPGCELNDAELEAVVGGKADNNDSIVVDQYNTINAYLDALGLLNSTLCGHGGDDTINAGLGNDYVYGGEGNDSLIGGSGSYDGNDYLDGGEGNDTIHGGQGVDTLIGGSGNDVLHGEDGADSMTGGAGNDRLGGGMGNDTMEGGKGNDVLDGSWGADILEGGSGNDTLRGGADLDFLYGGSGNDFLSGDGGMDFLDGGSGNDTLSGGFGDDEMTGGAGNDVFVLFDGITTYRSGGEEWDKITDFDPDKDTFQFPEGMDKADLSVSIVGENTWITYSTIYNTATVVLEEVHMSRDEIWERRESSD